MFFVWDGEEINKERQEIVVLSVSTTCDVKVLYYRQSTLLTIGSSLLGFTDFLTIANSQIKYLAACYMEKLDLVELGIIKFIE